ncbi:DUF3772 domain-containing protein [Shimia abyssi]|uniref:Small-conductance mechanosensitive channel n=1 Tax=Shimia abyssi TaxID=1662395 RepID=A0A2P8F697_9RHOB|nr:DUF3772 domain-containing protein [Shimia abyssi]PSL17247.1 small-conductance mechanosensitive channel [Shimia abyssi]
MRLLRHLCLVIATLVVMTGGSVLAQEVPDYGAWEAVADRASEAIQNDRASEPAMASLRDEIADWREVFSEETSRQRVSVQTLQAQLDALGPKPADGVADEAADQRADIEAELAAARKPARTADLARAEAEELIRAIDSLLRNRQLDVLMTQGPSPLIPSTWGKAPGDVYRSFKLIWSEFVTGWAQERHRNELQSSLPVMLFYLAIGIVLIVRGSPWTQRGLSRIVHDKMSAGRWILAFLLSFGQVVLPMLGVLALTKAVYATDLPGFRGDVMLSVLPVVTFELLIAKWLGERIFSRHETPLLQVHLSNREKNIGRSMGVVLGFALAGNTFFAYLARYDEWAPESETMVFFVLMLVAAAALSRVAMLIGRHSQELQGGPEEGRSPIGQMIYLISRFMLIVALAGMVLGMVGMTRMAAFVVFATTKTVLLVAFLLVAQRLIKKIFAALSGNLETDEDSLLAPVLVGTLLVIASTPILALTWGARVSDLTEFWSKVAAGIQLGGTTISPRDVAIFFLIFLIGYGLTRLAQGMMRVSILPKTKIDPGGQNAIVSGLGYVGIFIAALVAINTAGIDLGNVALFAGALSVGIGFGLQTIVSNFVSGIILLIERPVSEGDWIEVGGQMGYVRDISVRSTRIETFDRTDVIVPNSDLISGTVTNYTRGNTVGRVIVPVGVAYGTDTRRIERILGEIANAHPMVLAKPAPSVVFQGFGADSLDFEIRAILRDVNWALSVKSDMNHEIARRFTEEEIEIPFAQRDVWLRNPETLAGRSAPPEDATEKRGDVISPDMSDLDPGEDSGDGGEGASR